MVRKFPILKYIAYSEYRSFIAINKEKTRKQENILESSVHNIIFVKLEKIYSVFIEIIKIEDSEKRKIIKLS